MDAKGPLRRKGIEARKLGAEWLLYDSVTGAVHILNASAGSVWFLCDGRHTLAEMALRLREEYDVPADANPQADLEAILASFAEKGILAGVAADAPGCCSGPSA